jgi:multiple sugar transport system permease protein
MKTSSLSKLRTQEEAAAWLFILPNLLGFVVFDLLPIVAAIALSFCQWKLLDKIQWIGFQNYGFMLNDAVFGLSLKNTLIFTIISVPLTLAVGLLIAVELITSCRRSVF